jgi:hypothetical protein
MDRTLTTAETVEDEFIIIVVAFLFNFTDSALIGFSAPKLERTFLQDTHLQHAARTSISPRWPDRRSQTRSRLRQPTRARR